MNTSEAQDRQGVYDRARRVNEVNQTSGRPALRYIRRLRLLTSLVLGRSRASASTRRSGR